jgi:hypothetical protein
LVSSFRYDDGLVFFEILRGKKQEKKKKEKKTRAERRGERREERRKERRKEKRRERREDVGYRGRKSTRRGVNRRYSRLESTQLMGSSGEPHTVSHIYKLTAMTYPLVIKAEPKLGIAVDSVFMVGHVAEVFIGNVVEEFSDQLLLRSHIQTGEEQVPKVGTCVGNMDWR